MERRLELDSILRNICPNVYFQPPANLEMKYPCIRYVRSKPRGIFADNNLYISRKCYTVTVIDENPDSNIPDKVASLQLCSFDRHYASDNLNHDVFTLYY